MSSRLGCFRHLLCPPSAVPAEHSMYASSTWKWSRRWHSCPARCLEIQVPTGSPSHCRTTPPPQRGKEFVKGHPRHVPTSHFSSSSDAFIRVTCIFERRQAAVYSRHDSWKQIRNRLITMQRFYNATGPPQRTIKGLREMSSSTRIQVCKNLAVTLQSVARRRCYMFVSFVFECRKPVDRPF